MAVTLNKIILLMFFFLLSNISFGGEKNTELSNMAFNLSKKKYESARLNLENAIRNCEKNRSIVPSKLILPLKLKYDELKIALFVLNNRAEEMCEGDARNIFHYMSAKHRQVSKYYDFSSGDAKDYTEELMFSSEWKKLEFEAKYYSIDRSIRAKLESIEELKVPFQLFKTLDELSSAK